MIVVFVLLVFFAGALGGAALMAIAAAAGRADDWADRGGDPCPTCGHRLSAFDWCPACLAHQEVVS